MCESCGCPASSKRDGHGPGQVETVAVLSRLLAANDREVAHNRQLFDKAGVLCINLMSSPGAGKTALLEATIEAIGDRLSIGVIEGDLETENDAERIRAKGVPAVQITTGTACHLDAHMVHRALHQLDLSALDILFIENVGNLVCPASFDLGHHLSVTLLSTTEGDDKPSKYPVMFRAADLVLLTKSDLLPVLGDFDPGRGAAFAQPGEPCAMPYRCRRARRTRLRPGLPGWTKSWRPCGPAILCVRRARALSAQPNRSAWR